MGASVARPKYLGEVLGKERHGQGRMVWSDGRKYDGTFVRGNREGTGTMELSNGDRYVGEWSLDQMHGQGKYVSSGGEYEGGWVKGLREGKGKLTLKTGTVYEGGFARHQYHGRGVLKMQNGTYYEGEFVRGQIDGKGLRTFADGSIYEGEFLQGNVNGHGRWYSTTDGGWLFDGVFYHGRPVDGEMTHPDGQVWHYVYPASTNDKRGFTGQNFEPGLKRYIGSYGKGWDGHRDFTGSMIWKWADGREFRGQFQDGAPVRGRLYDRDKAWYDAEYDGGSCITDERLKPAFKKLAPEEVEKDLAFSRNLQEIQQRLQSEEEAYEQMLRAIELELEARVLAETKLWLPPPPPTPSPEPNYGGFERVSSSLQVAIEVRLGIDFHLTGIAGSRERAEFMANFILDLVNATATHERIFRVSKLTLESSGVVIGVEILPDPKHEFMVRTPAEIAVFLLEQSSKPLSKFMRGKLTKKMRSIYLNDHVYQVLADEARAKLPKTIKSIEKQEDLPPPPPQWSRVIEHRTWHPDVLGVGFHVGRIDIRAAAQYKAQLEAVHTYNIEQLAKRPKTPPCILIPEPEYLSGDDLAEQIREFIAFLYAGASLKDTTKTDDEKYSTKPNTAATEAHPKTAYTREGIGKSVQSSQGVVRERRDQRRAAKGLLELLGGNPDGTIDSENGWYVEPLFNKKLAQATSTAEMLWARGGIKALVYVLRGAYPDHEFTEDLSKARNEVEREKIIKASVEKGGVDIRELAAECILRACELVPSNRMRIRMKIGPHRPEGDGVLALVDLLQRGPDGSRERAAAAIAVICKGDLTSKEDVSLESGIEALLELFATHCPAALKLVEAKRLYDMAESRKFRASSAANQQMRVTLMEEAQKEMDLLADYRHVLEHRLMKLKEAGVEAIYTLTTDCHSACESVLVAGGFEVMKETIVDRRKIDAHSREAIIEIGAATGIIENVCRSFFQPGVLKEPANVSPRKVGTPAASSARGALEKTISINQRQSLLNEFEKLDLVALLLELLQPHVEVQIQSRAAGALWAIVEGFHDHTARILALDGMPLLMKLLMYGASGDQDELEARELTVGLISSMLKDDESCAIAAKSCGAVARLMQLMNLGDDGLGAFSTTELAASALVEALNTSEVCRTEARRSGIRQMIKALMESPVLNSPIDLERQQAKSSRDWAQKLLYLVNRPPHRGVMGTPKVDLNWGVAPSIKIQCNYRMHFSRRKFRQYRAMPVSLRQSLLRIENAITNIAAFEKYCALETEDGDGGHLGSRAKTMDVHEWIEVLKHLGILFMHADDHNKVSKTQAIAAFKSMNADAQKTINGRKLPTPQELDHNRYQGCLKRCLKMLRSEAEATGEVEAEEDRTESPLARGGNSRKQPPPAPFGDMFKRTHSTVLKRVRGPLVGKKSVLHMLTSGPEGGVPDVAAACC